MRESVPEEYEIELMGGKDGSRCRYICKFKVGRLWLRIFLSDQGWSDRRNHQVCDIL